MPKLKRQARGEHCGDRHGHEPFPSSVTHVRVTILTRIPLKQCDLCLRLGQRGFNAAYSVLDVLVCREHLAKIIDAASKPPTATTTEETDRSVHADVNSLNRFRKSKKVGICDIPDHLPDFYSTARGSSWLSLLERAFRRAARFHGGRNCGAQPQNFDNR